MANYEKLSVPELEAEIQKLQAESSAANAKQEPLRAALDEKLTSASTDALLESLSDSQKEALKEALGGDS